MSKIFVCFIGIDGAGKSAITTNVYENIRSTNTKVKRTYGRFQPLITKFVMKLGRRFFLKNSDMFSDYEKYLDNKKSVFKKSPMLANMYFSLMIMEYYFEIIFKIIIPYKLGYSIVSDRYVYDTIINDIAIDMSLSIDEVNELLKNFWRFIPKPDITFLIHVPEEVAMKRKNDIPSLNYLKIRSTLYNELAAKQKIIVLDGTLNINELGQKVCSEIDNMKS